MEVTTKRRQIPFHKGSPGILKTTIARPSPPIGGGTTVNKTVVPAWDPHLKGSQETVSENHPQWKQSRKGRFTGDVGGEFLSQKRFIRCVPTHWSTATTSKLDSVTTRHDYFSGECVCSSFPVWAAWPSYLRSTNSVLDAWGAKAVAQSKPTNSVVDLATALGELFSVGGIPSKVAVATWKAKTAEQLVKRGSKDHLAIEFGYKPIVSDMYKLAHAVTQSDQIMNQYVRDAGRLVRRRWSFQPVESWSSSTLETGKVPHVGASGAFMVNNDSARGEVRRVIHTSVHRWFSGAFTYHLPKEWGGVFGEYAAKADKLLGLAPTPETIWNLTPWSWALDWFSNAGDVISNLSDYATDGLVMQYGYMMEHTVHRHFHYWEGDYSYYKGSPYPASFEIIVETKVRRKANPFGFGLTWGGLSPRQLAISVALGISKLG